MSNPFDSDPWADNSAYAIEDTPEYPEAEAEQPGEAQDFITVTPEYQERPNVQNAEAKIVTTIKYGSGFDAPWTVFHSNTVEEATATLKTAKALMELTAEVARFAKTLDSGTAPRAVAAAPAAPQAASSTPPGTEAKNCAHGPMVYRTGTGAKGPWQAHFCSTPKGTPDQCKAIFVR